MHMTCVRHQSRRAAAELILNEEYGYTVAMKNQKINKSASSGGGRKTEDGGSEGWYH